MHIFLGLLCTGAAAYTANAALLGHDRRAGFGLAALLILSIATGQYGCSPTVCP